MLIMLFFFISIIAFIVSQILFFKKKNIVGENRKQYLRTLVPFLLLLLQFIMTKTIVMSRTIALVVYIVLCASAAYNILQLRKAKRNGVEKEAGYLMASIVSGIAYILLNLTFIAIVFLLNKQG